MSRPEITPDKIVPMLSTRFINVFDIQYEEGRHYYDASRRQRENLIALKDNASFQAMTADAATCFVIIRTPGDEDRLLLTYEYRYPTGQYLLSPPAGLMDPTDRDFADPLLETALREIKEETGISLKMQDRSDNLPKDRLFTVNPLVFSTPGMSDECNGLVCAIAHMKDLSSLTQSGAEGTEVFDGFELLTKQEARKVLLDGRDKHGNFYSAYTWMALMYFISGLYENPET
ncbi:MAG: NUDIX hydrolase [Firmicutes bacterium]|nr:NUDIX hydrolase [Bacillota bacterium]